MNKKQYNNVIENTLKHEQTDDSLSTARAIFDNMGVALPQGDIKTVYETIQTDNYMGWKSCTMKEAQEAANNGTAAIGISEDKIVVLSAKDEEQPVTQTASVMTLDENTSAFAVDGLRYYSYSYSCTTCNPSYVPTNNRYFHELKTTFGFSCEEANLIMSLYSKVECVFCSESIITKAWICSRLLGGMVYDKGKKFGVFPLNLIRWNDVAGRVFTCSEDLFFTNQLGFTTDEYNSLLLCINRNHGESHTSDFAHMQISLSARLAYHLNLTGSLSNIYTGYTDEVISYLAGWFGDATIVGESGTTTTFGNDDYCADLDAECVFRLVLQGYTILEALTSYYTSISCNFTRAQYFKTYIDYQKAKSMIYYELIDKELLNKVSQHIITPSEYLELINNEQYHMDIIFTNYPDTYAFLYSLQNGLADIV